MQNYNIIKNVIKAGGYDLAAILTRIDTFWAEGSLTDDQRSELRELARAEATPEAGVDYFEKLRELEERIKALEEGKTDGSETTIEDFVPGRWYYTGDKCVWNGAVYTCIAPEGTVCVWSPEEYPAYWTKEE